MKPLCLIIKSGLGTENGVAEPSSDSTREQSRLLPQVFRDFGESVRVLAPPGSICLYAPYSLPADRSLQEVYDAWRAGFRIVFAGHSFGAAWTKWACKELTDPEFGGVITAVVWWDMAPNWDRFGQVFPWQAGDAPNGGAHRPGLPTNVVKSALAFTQRRGPWTPLGIVAGCQLREDLPTYRNIRCNEQPWGGGIDHVNMPAHPEVQELSRAFILEAVANSNSGARP